ncbi:unnamed protein product [Calypogeia fissa]
MVEESPARSNVRTRSYASTKEREEDKALESRPEPRLRGSGARNSLTLTTDIHTHGAEGGTQDGQAGRQGSSPNGQADGPNQIPNLAPPQTPILLEDFLSLSLPLLLSPVNQSVFRLSGGWGLSLIKGGGRKEAAARSWEGANGSPGLLKLCSSSIYPG